MLYRCGDEASAYDKLQRVIGLSKRSRSRGTARGVHALMDDTGRVVTDAHAIAEVFRRHISRSSAAARELTAAESELLRRTAATPPTRGTANLHTPATENEVQRLIKHLQNGKAAGPDGTYPELLKIGGDDTLRAVTALFNAVLRTGIWPTRWGEGDVVPIPKPGGDKLQANDYRGISLLPVLSKVLEAVLNTRLSQWLEENGALHDAQHGFRPGRSTLDAAFVLHELVAATRETATRSRRTAAQRAAQSAPAPAPHHTIFVAYLDVKKAYDECWRQAIIAQLRARGIDAHTCALFSSMLAAGKVRRTVRVDGVRSAEFGVDVGVPQGAVLSPALYNTFIDGIARALEADPRGFGAVAHGIRVPALLYADDIALFAHSAEQLQQMLDVCAQYAQRWRFSFNAAKCAVQIAGRDAAAGRTRSAQHPFTIADGTGHRHSVQVVETFKYLGLRPDFSQPAGHSARWDAQLNALIGAANRASAQLFAAVRQRRWLAPATVMRLFGTYCAPKAEYGAQIWAPFMRSQQRRRLNRIQSAAQMRALLPYATHATTTPHCFGAGEFARAPFAAHCDELALRYLHHIARAPPDTALRRLFDARMTAARRRATAIAGGRSADGGAQSWCWAMRATCAQYGLSDTWNGTTPLPPDRSEWLSTCHKAVNTQWTSRLRDEAHAHSTTRELYGARDSTRKLWPQPYLYVAAAAHNARDVIVQTRAGALPLGVVRADLLRRARDAARQRAAASAAPAPHTLAPSACPDAAPAAADGSAGHHDATTVSDSEIAAAERCDECALCGVACTDTSEHFIARCNPQRYDALIRIIGAALHRIGHRVSPDTRLECRAAHNAHGAHRVLLSPPKQHEATASNPRATHTTRTAHDTGASVSDWCPCDGHLMERNFSAARVADQISACLRGNGAWILRGTTCGKSQSTLRSVTQALVRCAQNFLLLRWRERCTKIGASPVVAFAHANFGRQVMSRNPNSNSSYRLLLPMPLPVSAASAPFRADRPALALAIQPLSPTAIPIS